MYEKELLEQIIDCRLGLEELENFNANLKKEELDLDNPFDKYYSLQKILSAIEKYSNKEITEQYLSAWARAYDSIVRACYWLGDKSFWGPENFKESMQCEIGQRLYDLYKFKEKDFLSSDWEALIDEIVFLDKVYNKLDKWEAIFAPVDDDDDDIKGVAFLCVKRDEMQYFVIEAGVLGYRHYKIKEKKLTEKELWKMEEELKKKGYIEIKHLY